MASFEQLQKEIVHYGRMAFERGLVSAVDGNISARVSDNSILITASGTSLGELQPHHLLCLDENGQVLSGEGRPSAELAMHVAVYAARPDVQAMIHAHPPHGVACTLAGVSLEAPVIPEVVVMLGAIPTAPYATPCSQDSAQAVRNLIDRHDAMLLERHGSVTVGASLPEAFAKLDKLEYAARITLLAKSAGPVQPLDDPSVDKLRDLAKRLCS